VRVFFAVLVFAADLAGLFLAAAWVVARPFALDVVGTLRSHPIGTVAGAGAVAVVAALAALLSRRGKQEACST
jgi:hypothetical protein